MNLDKIVSLVIRVCCSPIVGLGFGAIVLGLTNNRPLGVTVAIIVTAITVEILHTVMK
jgi:hypothetical protein